MRKSSSEADSAAQRVGAYDYELPAASIAQHPLADREAARLLVVDRAAGDNSERVFRELGELLAPGDALVVNDTRVIAARLRARAAGRELEALLLRDIGAGRWRALLRPAKRAPLGTELTLGDGASARVVELGERGERTLAFAPGTDVLALLDSAGETPLPPYIRRPAEPADRDDYQTVFAAHPGAVAAPTAGLHFTEPGLRRVRERGVRVVPITLAVGLPTFRPLVEQSLDEVRLGAEPFTIPAAASEAIGETRRSGGRVVAVGTTVVRALESAWDDALGAPRPGDGESTLFVRPGHRFRAVDALVTNFHLPRTSLLVLVAAFAGRERILAAYRDALARGFRFASYGDAMLIL